MAAIILPRRWAQQPTGPVDIDVPHPLTRGLVAAFNGATLFDPVSGGTFSRTGSPLTTTVEGLRSLACESAGDGLSLTFRGIATSSPVSVVYRQAPRALNTAQKVLFALYGSASNVIVRRNGNGSVNTSSALLVQANASLRGLTLSSGHILGQSYNEMLSHAGGTVALIAKTPSQVVSSSTGNRHSPITKAYIGTDQAMATPGFSGIPYWYLYRREISDGERAELWRNPWQIFKPRRRVAYFDVPGAYWMLNGGTAHRYDGSEYVPILKSQVKRFDGSSWVAVP